LHGLSGTPDRRGGGRNGAFQIQPRKKENAVQDKFWERPRRGKKGYEGETASPYGGEKKGGKGVSYRRTDSGITGEGVAISRAKTAKRNRQRNTARALFKLKAKRGGIEEGKMSAIPGGKGGISGIWGGEFLFMDAEKVGAMGDPRDQFCGQRLEKGEGRKGVPPPTSTPEGVLPVGLFKNGRETKTQRIGCEKKGGKGKGKKKRTAMRLPLGLDYTAVFPPKRKGRRETGVREPP